MRNLIIYIAPGIVKIMKSQRIQCTGHVALTGGRGQQCIQNFDGKQTDGRLRRRLLLTWIFEKYEV
jgi:hypothetical protein